MQQCRYRWKIIIFFLFLSFVCQPQKGETSYFLFYDPQWRFASSTEAMENLLPFCDFLSTAVNIEIHPLYLKKSSTLDEHLTNSDIIIALINTQIILANQNVFSLTPRVVPVKQGRSTHEKAVFVMKNSQFTAMSDLKGKTLALIPTDRDTIDRQLSKIVKQELPPASQFFQAIVKAADSKSALSALIFGLSDSALTTLETFNASDSIIKENVKILYTSPPVKNSPVVTIKGRLTDEEEEVLIRALLSFHETEKGKKILLSLGIESFISSELQSTAAVSLSVPNSISSVVPDREDQRQAEVQPERELTEELQPEKESDYEIQKGDTLWKIAEKFLGSGEKYTHILKHNEINNPDLILVGSKIKIPPQSR